jgi:hypothetical protein
MAQFELNIYGKDDEIVARYESDRVRWGIFLQALELEEGLQGKSPRELIESISQFVKKIFPDLTDEHLAAADVDDVMNTFKQLLKKAKKIGGGAKNAAGAE